MELPCVCGSRALAALLGVTCRFATGGNDASGNFVDDHAKENDAANDGELHIVVFRKNQIDGIVMGVDQQGGLRLKVGGVEKVFSGGELSLRLRNDS